VTTQGGLDLKHADMRGIEKAIRRFKAAGIEVSLFVDPDAFGVRAAHNLGADAVELCTDAYCKAVGKHRQRAELERLELAAYLAHELKLDLYAGHGLDYTNVAPVVGLPHLKCLNIGFSIIARSVFSGLRGAVAEMRKLIDSAG
jgi:pyridoxine 5-phosphate synthase